MEGAADQPQLALMLQPLGGNLTHLTLSNGGHSWQTQPIML